MMTKTSEVKVRLDEEDAAILRRLMRKSGLTRSEVVRQSLRAFEEKARSEAALEQLLAWAEVDEKRIAAGDPPRKVRFRME